MLEIVYAKKQWTIFMRKQWTVLINVENRFYECNKQIRISQFSTLHALKVGQEGKYITNLILKDFKRNKIFGQEPASKLYVKT